ncbi:MAG TPA: hypothetical protein EYP49_00060 [Anaerolineae bacterium]|nr:hypothetical protein [Anaerolineae bacterium]
MNFKQAQLIGEFKQEIKRHFPHVTVLNHYEAPEEGIAIRVASPYEDAVEIMHRMSQKSVEILETYGYLIFVIPLENVTPEELTVMIEDLRAAREQELAELAA